jgi:mRNA interferase MazF
LPFSPQNKHTSSEQSGIRPVIVFHNNEIAKYSSTVIIIQLTTNLRRSELPTCVLISPNHNGLNEKPVALCHQIRVIDKSRIKMNIGKINSTTLFELESTILLTLGYDNS